MKVIVLVLVAAVSGALAASYGWGERLSALLNRSDEARHYLGFVEGENTLVAPPYSGRLAERPVERGDRVAKGARLFVIETTQAEADVARAKATLTELQARHRNLLSGQRADELEVIRAQRLETEASLVLAEQDLKRQADLHSHNVASHQSYDRAVAHVNELRARVASLVARERAGSLAARQDEIAAAAAMVEQGRASLVRAADRLDDLMPAAPEEALIESTFFNVGEWVTAGAPVVALLPDHRRKLRFFVHADEITKTQPGRPVSFTCDGCPANLVATISYVSPRAEYTPPVIYSQSARARVVFMVEARPTSTQVRLPPGLPVSVRLDSDAKP